MVKKVNINAFIVILFILAAQISCEKKDDFGHRDGYIRDIKTLQTIKQANPQSDLEWNFSFDDPSNPVISNYGENSSQADIKFEYIGGEERVIGLNISRKNISKLENLKNLSKLRTLDCYSNQLNSLDISENKSLTRLDCSSNKISSLDVSENKKLLWLDCHSNQLNALKISENEELLWLDCSSNEISSLDVSKNKKTTWLDCHSNSISSLDVSENKGLTILSCHSNRLNGLDVSKSKSLSTLDCHSNLLNSLNVSENKELTWLDCSLNPCSTEEHNGVAILNKFYDKAQSLSIYDDFYLKPAKNQENEKIYSVVNE